jgi:hypothetical protein
MFAALLYVEYLYQERMQKRHRELMQEKMRPWYKKLLGMK